MSVITLTDRIQVSVRAKNETEKSAQNKATGANIQKALGGSGLNDTDLEEIGNVNSIADENGNEWIKMEDIIAAGRKMKEKGAFADKHKGITIDGVNYNVSNLLPPETKLVEPNFTRKGYYSFKHLGDTYNGNRYSDCRIIDYHVEISGSYTAGGIFMPSYDENTKPESILNVAYCFIFRNNMPAPTLTQVEKTLYTYSDNEVNFSDIETWTSGFINLDNGYWHVDSAGSKIYYYLLNELHMNDSDIPISYTYGTARLPAALCMNYASTIRTPNNLFNGVALAAYHYGPVSGSSIIDWDAPNAEVERQIKNLHDTWDVSDHAGAVTGNGTYVLAGPIEFNDGD